MRLLGVRARRPCLCPQLGIGEDAGSKAKYLFPSSKTGGRRVPAPLQTPFQKLASGWFMVEDGDRRHAAHSGAVIDQVECAVSWLPGGHDRAGKRNEYVVGVLILCYNLLDRSRTCPLRHSCQRRLPPD